jgi:hypothetical protein
MAEQNANQLECSVAGAAEDRDLDHVPFRSHNESEDSLEL